MSKIDDKKDVMDIENLLDPKKNKNAASRLAIFAELKKKNKVPIDIIDKLINASIHNLVTSTIDNFDVYFNELSIYLRERQLQSEIEKLSEISEKQLHSVEKLYRSLEYLIDVTQQLNKSSINQILAIEKLNEISGKQLYFVEKLNETNENQLLSTKRLCKSSENLEVLSYVIILLTVVLALIEIIKIANGN